MSNAIKKLKADEKKIIMSYAINTLSAQVPSARTWQIFMKNRIGFFGFTEPYI